jgi:outer membrane protein assembly factor BamB
MIRIIQNIFVIAIKYSHKLCGLMFIAMAILPCSEALRAEDADAADSLVRGLRVYYDFEESGSAGLANKAAVPHDYYNAARYGGGAFDSSANPSGPGFAGKADFNPGNGASDRSALVAGKALNLVDSRNDAISVPVGTIDLGSSFTIAAWHALTPSGGSVDRPFVFEGSDNHNVSWGIGSGDNYTAYVTQSAAVSAALERGVWQHVAHVFSTEYDSPTRSMAIRLRLYVNGELVGTQTAADANAMRFSALHFGKHRSSDFSRAWDGMLDEVGLWSRSLSEEEVKDLYELGVAGTPLSTLITPHAASYAGQVYHTVDGSRSPLAGVAVSDGLNVVKTDAEGRFTLPGTARTRFISLTVPSGYRTVGEHYIPVRKNIGDYDFELEPYELTAGDGVRFLQLTDTETNEDTGGWIASISEYSADQDMGFIMHTGDICYGYGMPFHAENVNAQTLGRPIFYSIGNHDLERGAYGEEMFEDLFGPSYYSFEAGNTHFVVTPMSGGTHAPSYSVDQVYRWLLNDLANKDPDKNLVVFNHFWKGSLDDNFYYGPSSSARVLLNDHDLKLWASGHLHANYMKSYGDTGIISVQAAPAIKGGINHGTGNAVDFEIDSSGTVHVEPVYTRISDHLVLVAPRGVHQPRRADGRLSLVVNAYDSQSPFQSVEMRIGADGEWLALERKTDWNWARELNPAGLVDGSEYPVSVRATKNNGALVSREESFVYSADGGAASAGLRLDWVRNTGANSLYASPLVVDGTVYVSAVSVFDHANNRIMAYRLSDGELLWQADVPNPIHGAINYDSGRVLGTDQEGIAYAWDAASGARLWSRALGRSSATVYSGGGTAQDGVYYTGFGNYLSALNVSDGTVRWRSTSWSSGYSASPEHRIVGENLLVGAQWGALYAHAISNGAQRWRDNANGLGSRGSTAVAYDGRVYALGSTSLVQKDPSSGSTLQVSPTPANSDVGGVPLVDADRVVAGTSGAGMVSYDRETGAVQWQVQTDPALVNTSPYTQPPSRTAHSTAVSLGGQILFGASDGILYKVDAASGEIVHRLDLGAPLMSVPTLSDEGALLLSDFAGNLYKFTRAELSKADNEVALDTAESWNEGRDPTADDVLVFDERYTLDEELVTSAGLEIAGIRIAGGASAVRIAAPSGQALRIAGEGVDMAAAGRDLQLRNAQITEAQEWNIALGRTLGAAEITALDDTALITKTGAGTLLLEGANELAGIRVAEGALQVADVAALGAAQIVLAGGVLRVPAGESVSNEIVFEDESGNSAVETAMPPIDCLLVGGGGGGNTTISGNSYGAGGGGGAVVDMRALQLSADSHEIVVGGGGSAGSAPYLEAGNTAQPGGESSAFGLIAAGGRPGSESVAGSGGASGGGHAGGLRDTYAPGGGGGAGAAGANGINSSPRRGGDGGPGIASDIAGTEAHYGGGGGGHEYSTNIVGQGGIGGGGEGGQPGQANTGGGGGGSAAGGSGLVVLRYPGPPSATGGEISAGTGTAEGYTLHSFSAAGAHVFDFDAGMVALGGSIAGGAVVRGGLHLREGSRLGLSSSGSSIHVDGQVVFDSFGGEDVEGLGDATTDGSYTLVEGEIDARNIRNIGSENRFKVGGRKHAYFEMVEGGMALMVETDPPPPLRIAAISPQLGGGRRIAFTGGESGSYSLEYLSALSSESNAWQQLSVEEHDSYNGDEVSMIPDAEEGDRCRFYRIRSVEL